MASSSPLLLLLQFVPFLLLVSTARISDVEALRLLLTDLGGDLLRPSETGGRGPHPCGVAGIVCERWNGGATRAIRIALPFLGLEGTLSPALGSLSALRELSLAGNLLFGAIPSEISGCRELRMLDLGGNALSGRVPREISSLGKLQSLDLSGNQLRGELGFLTVFPNLENLSLADNLFTGRVPPSVSFFRNLRFIDLSGNPGLRGPFPDLPVTVEVVPLHHGRRGDDAVLPQRYVLAERNSTGNHNATEATRRRGGLNATAPAPAPTGSEATSHRRHKRKLSTCILGFVVEAVSGLFSGTATAVLLRFLVNCISGRYRRPAGPAIFTPLLKAKQLAILAKEDGLESLEVIGRGGCGIVYKMTLPPPPGPGNNAAGRTLAVKKIMKQSPDVGTASELSEAESRLLDKRMRQMRSEINTVGHVRHRNLLPLLAHVPLPDCHLLVYEYMKNGSLQEALNGDAEGSRELDWPARHRIAMGIAAGLEHLHLQHSPRIVHRDLKPANILLDDKMEARIADFGLAKAVPDANTHVTTSNVAGTVGYIAPEYHGTLRFTDKCDIYSFGVILAVVVVGKTPTDEFFQGTEEMSLVKWVRNLMAAGAAEGALDAKLRGKGHDEQMKLVLKLACLCTVDDAKERPNSKEVRRMLAGIPAALPYQSPSPKLEKPEVQISESG